MTTQFESEQDARVSTLVSEIVQDARTLFVQQMTLFQVELKNDLRKAGLALIPMAIGLLVMMTAPLLLGMGAAHLLCAIVPDMPLWGGFLTVGFAIAVIGALLAWWGKSQLAAVKPVDTALKGLEETLQWKTKN